VRRDRLRILDGTAVLEVGGDAGGSESVAAGGVGESCFKGPPLYHSQDIGSGQWVLCDLPVSVNTAKQRCFLLVSDARGALARV